MKRLAIFLDGGAYDQGSLRSAVKVADLLDAHLDVLYPWTAEALRAALPVGYSALANDLVGPGGQNAARNAFDRVCHGLPNARWVNVSGRMADAIRVFGLHYDALMLRRPSEEKGPQARALNVALFKTGTPILVTPPITSPAIGSSVAVVWSGTPQSSRTIRSAMPLLRIAKAVHVLTNSANPLATPERMLEYLGISGIQAKHVAFDAESLTARGRGRAIIDAAQSVSADVLIMGGFGEYRANTLFGLGRTTRKLVTAAPMPLLLQS
jgi:nucleotide-binding universal stress UspA family protein